MKKASFREDVMRTKRFLMVLWLAKNIPVARGALVRRRAAIDDDHVDAVLVRDSRIIVSRMMRLGRRGGKLLR